jgi:hypothetical protein
VNLPVAQTDSHSSFALLMKQADVLAQSAVIPRSYQRRPQDVVAAGLAGQAFGWDVMTSLRNYHVIEGTATLRPEAMLGLVRRAGHSVTLSFENDDANGRTAVAFGRRSDNGDEHRSTFSLADAKVAGLFGKKNWNQYEDAMLTWRSVSALCRVLFPDVVLGAGYVPEEIGGDVNSEGVPVNDDDPFAEPMIPAAPAKRELLDACANDMELAKKLWAERGSTSISRSDLDALMREAVMADIAEAELVDGTTATMEEAVELVSETFSATEVVSEESTKGRKK